MTTPASAQWEQVGDCQREQLSAGKASAMLVLTRKEAETICIGENIVIRVTRIGGTSVKIGIEAPDNVRVLRGELVLEEPVPIPVIPVVFGPMRVVSDQFPHVA
jgi:carbon storage regulator